MYGGGEKGYTDYPTLNYQYVNSERDFTLPLQKHKNFQTPYESPDDGDYKNSLFILNNAQ